MRGFQSSISSWPMAVRGRGFAGFQASGQAAQEGGGGRVRQRDGAVVPAARLPTSQSHCDVARRQRAASARAARRRRPRYGTRRRVARLVKRQAQACAGRIIATWMSGGPAARRPAKWRWKPLGPSTTGRSGRRPLPYPRCRPGAAGLDGTAPWSAPGAAGRRHASAPAAPGLSRRSVMVARAACAQRVGRRARVAGRAAGGRAAAGPARWAWRRAARRAARAVAGRVVPGRRARSR